MGNKFKNIRAKFFQRSHRADSGQGVLEYVLLMAIVVNLFLILSHGLGKLGLSEKLMKIVTGPYAKAYRYGHPQAAGFEDGESPKMHPRFVSGGGEESAGTRIFINPRSK